ncbi:hypothetical protein JEQ07_23875 [Serratia proteamaculans]|uniref:Uncharacterized protein n=1 Tax=Serratia proteamaculans TaxID=28151 RepID=A0ABS0TYG8_SERPR|nr:hypothetical protein [Serratia proteamaculans]MBI6183420.1 hypothetical protein [Serratia proteamaculans]
MSETKSYDYLVIGGEHDGEVFNGDRLSILALASKIQPMAKLYSRETPAEVTVPKMVEYTVIEHITESGVHFFIASNDDLTNINIDVKIAKSGISPIA